MSGHITKVRTPSSRSSVEPGAGHATACLSCRSARQKCNRREPCDRCTNHGLVCEFPHRSFRGRKQGSTNKPDTVEKLLARISESAVGEEVIAAILRREQRKDKQPPSRDPSENESPPEALISPLQILAAAVEADRNSLPAITRTADRLNDAAGDAGNESNRGLSPSFRGSHSTSTSSYVDERLSRYFAPRGADRTDWETLALQPIESSFKLDPSAFDPISARLVNEDDIVLYFQLFYEFRNPWVGLLDPALHTPEFVRASSFTLFSALCAAGCALSTRPRDRILYPALNALSEDCIKWSIGNGVRSIETVQAIIYAAYASSAYERQCDDPCWLRISHATQLARELGLDRPDAYAKRINSLGSMTPELQGRLIRNVERTWLYAFIVDKSFGIIAGRLMSVSWREIPTNLAGWWSRPYAQPLDYQIQGLVEMRTAYIKLVEERHGLRRSADAVFRWQKRAVSTIGGIREAWCDSTDVRHPSAKYIPILRVYMSHAILFINGLALRQLISLDAKDDPKFHSHLATVSKDTVDAAIEYIDMVTQGQFVRHISRGICNTAYIQTCHAATEILLAIKRSSIPTASIADAASRIRLVAEYLEDLARAVPTSSWAPIYASLAQGFVAQVNAISNPSNNLGISQADEQTQTEPWWKQPLPLLGGVDGNTFDFASVFDVGFLGTAPEAAIYGNTMDYDFMSSFEVP